MDTPLNFAAAIIVTDRYCRAPKGGTTIAGKFFKGGQFCPNALPDDLAALLAKPAPARVSIAGFSYAVRPLAIAASIGTAAFAMDRIDTGHSYAVHRDVHGEVCCDCPDFTMRRAGSGKPCKHGRELVELGLIPATSPRSLPPFARRQPSPAAPPARTRRFVPSAEDFALAAEALGWRA